MGELGALSVQVLKDSQLVTLKVELCYIYTIYITTTIFSFLGDAWSWRTYQRSERNSQYDFDSRGEGSTGVNGPSVPLLTEAT